MEEKNKKIWRNWKLWVGIVLAIIVIICVIIFAMRNKMTPEETVSKFMYLVENKEYEKAKKLCSGQLEHLDLLANVKPSKLSFEFSEDKKQATTILLEEEIKVTKLNVKLGHSLMGYKIKDFNIAVELMEPQIIEDRLKANKEVTDMQLLYWGESEVANRDEIMEYAKDNGMVALIFAETMKSQNYDKANELYEVISQLDLTVDDLKEYDWSNYKILSNFQIIENFNSITVKLGDKKVWIYVAGKQVTSIKEATI